MNNQPDLFATDFNLASESQPDTSAWSVAAETARSDAIKAEREKQTSLLPCLPLS